ncbi:hypothetical protein MASR1M107_18360 [Ignavibacteriales bacterium]
MKNLIERLSIKSGLTKIEVSALIFVIIAISTGALIQIFRSDSKSVIPGPKEKSSSQLLKEETQKVEKEKGKSGKKTKNGSKKKTPPASPININSASAEELMTLPGIGKKTASLIVEMRDKLKKELGRGFSSIEEIKLVRGIGENKFEQIKSYLTL